MAVLPMKRVTIIGHRDDQAKLVSVLQGAGVIEVSKPHEDEEIAAGEGTLAAFRADQIKQGLSKVQFVRSFIGRLQTAKTGIIAGLLPDRFELAFPDFQRIGGKLDFETIYNKASKIDSAIIDTDAAIRSLETDKESLSPWAPLDVAFSELPSTGKIRAVLGRASGISGEQLTAQINNAAPPADTTIVNQIGDVIYFAVIYQARYARDLQQSFADLGVDVFEPIRSGKASEEIRLIDERFVGLHAEHRRLEKEAHTLLKYTRDLRILEDWLHGQLARCEVQEHFGGTHSVFTIEGWVEARRAEDLAQLLRSESRVVDYAFSDPAAGDHVPTVMQNPRWSRSFEVLTSLYGLPNYNEIDPTPIMGAFFCLFFGVALGDAGYGLILSCFCLWLGRRLLLTPAGRQWMELFTLGGVASMVVGVMTGSYFGLPIEALPASLKRLIVLDPLRQALLFLLLTLALGAIHVILGMILELWNNWRRHNYRHAVYRALPALGVAISATVVAAAWVMLMVLKIESPVYSSILAVGIKVLGWMVLLYILASGECLAVCAGIVGGAISPREKESRVDNVLAAALLAVIIAVFVAPIPSRWLVFLAALVIGLALSVAFRRAAAALGGGMYNLYGMTSFLNNVLSYSRLMALGLATFLIGFVINILAGLLVGIAPGGIPIGYVLAPLMALPLHIANLVINLLGAFVHPLRLQFVEFFSQFYEDGGHVFAPFAFETEHLILKGE
jgi:V/A-type H+-transporting ATPase subunit I